MELRPLAAADEARFDALARAHGRVFDTLAWSDTVGGGIERLGYYSSGGELVGGCTIRTTSYWGLPIVRTLPFTPSVGPFFEPLAESTVGANDRTKRFLDTLAAHLDDRGSAVTAVALDRRFVDAQPFIWRDFKVVPKYTYLVDLARDVDTLFKGLSSTRRRNIRKARKQGVVVGAGSPDEVAALVRKTFGRQDKGIDADVLHRVLDRYTGEGLGKGFVARKDGRPISAVFCVQDQRTAYYLLGGYDEDNKHHGAGALAMWEAITWAKERGLSEFDFEGSMQPQIERYFRGFGGELVPVMTINKAWLPLEMALKLFRRSQF